MRYFVVVLIVATLALFAALILIQEPQKKGEDPVNTSSSASGELQIVDETVGDGPAAKCGDRVKVHYTGTFKNGEVFDSSVPRNEPFSFSLGAGEVIKGWDQGVAGMKVGGKRKLVVPYELAYGVHGRGTIPPKAELTFVVELLGIY